MKIIKLIAKKIRGLSGNNSPLVITSNGRTKTKHPALRNFLHRIRRVFLVLCVASAAVAQETVPNKVRAIQFGTWTLAGSSVSVTGSTLSVTGLSGAALATSALQTTGNSSLSSIDGKITAVNTGAVTVVAVPLTRTTVDIDSTTLANPTNVVLKAETTKVIGTINISASQSIGVTGVVRTTVDKDSTTLANPTNVLLPAETTKVIGTVNIAASQTIGLLAGSALVGKVGIDQTTPGTTNRVDATIAAAQTLGTVTTVGAVTSITNALPAGTNLIGKTGIDQTTPGTTNKVSIGTDGTVALNAALPAGTNSIGTVVPSISSIAVYNVAGSTFTVLGNITQVGGTAVPLGPDGNYSLPFRNTEMARLLEQQVILRIEANTQALMMMDGRSGGSGYELK